MGTFGALGPFEGWSNRTSADRAVAVKRHILATFGRLLEISNAVQPPLATGDLALHIWKRQRTPAHPISGVLKRIASCRMSTYPGNRPFLPMKGVGVVGLCWLGNKEISKDVTGLADELTDQAAYDTYVAAHGLNAVMGLSWREFDNVKHRTALFATPIRNGRGRFVGCISVDASRGFDVLDKRELMEAIGNLALTIGLEDFECT
ncbi:MAG TPA: hypothetical protein VEO01_21875 [Pseudonocardiaceae bacterium]|nr:hypothetical protein [Pseudonocardiaceae bacterium]